jgi:type II secretory pathway pseudopilin PulG
MPPLFCCHARAIGRRPRLSKSRYLAARRRGVTLIETLLAVMLATMASSALLLTVENALSTSNDSVDRALADGIAQQLLDEVAQKLYSATANTASTPGRSRFNDINDYHGWTAAPLQGVYGEPLGTGNDAGQPRPAAFQLPADYFQRWRQTVSVYPVDPVTLQRVSSETSLCQCIEVVVEQLDHHGAYVALATKKRVTTYVPR